MIDEVYFLTVEEVIAIHADQIDRYGGDSGLRHAPFVNRARFGLTATGPDSSLGPRFRGDAARR